MGQHIPSRGGDDGEVHRPDPLADGDDVDPPSPAPGPSDDRWWSWSLSWRWWVAALAIPLAYVLTIEQDGYGRIPALTDTANVTAFVIDLGLRYVFYVALLVGVPSLIIRAVRSEPEEPKVNAIGHTLLAVGLAAPLVVGGALEQGVAPTATGDGDGRTLDDIEPICLATDDWLIALHSVARSDDFDAVMLRHNAEIIRTARDLGATDLREAAVDAQQSYRQLMELREGGSNTSAAEDSVARSLTEITSVCRNLGFDFSIS